MRAFVLSCVVAVGLAASVPAFAEEASTPPVAEPAKPEKPVKPGKKPPEDPNRMICTREHVVGSNRPQRVCMTVAERQRLKDEVPKGMTGSGHVTTGSGNGPS